MGTAVLSVSDARKKYGSTPALDGASLHLHQGEWLALLGPNGAGKTTLLKAVAGRVRLDSGEVTLLGERLDQARGDGRSNGAPARHRLGIVPQEIAIYPLLTAEENLRAFGELNGVHGTTLRERVQWAMEWTGLGEHRRKLAQSFSGGMRRRLNIGCGVLHQPEVVLLDEPTVGVDPQSRQRIWEMLAALRSAGASLLLTTHQLDEAQQVCDRIVIIDHGKDIATGTLDELVAKTIGRGRRVTLVLEAPLPAGSLHGLTSENGCELSGSVRDVAGELPGLLTQVAAAGGRVCDVRIEAPSLHNVFLHLTGRELRE